MVIIKQKGRRVVAFLLQVFTDSPEATEDLGEELGKLLQPDDVVALVGELGAGKTVFVHGIARALGVEDTVSSPSFLIVQEYRGQCPLFHCDFYRVNSYQELEDIGWEEYLNRGGVVVIEWANLIPEALPGEYLRVVFSFCEPSASSRCLEFYPIGRRYQEIVKELAKRCGYWE